MSKKPMFKFDDTDEAVKISLPDLPVTPPPINSAADFADSSFESEEDEVYNVQKDYEAFFTSDVSDAGNAAAEVTAEIPGGNVADMTRQIDIVKKDKSQEVYMKIPEEIDEIQAEKKSVSEKKTTKSLIDAQRKKIAIKKRARRKQEHVRTFTHVFGSILLVIFIVSVSALLSQFIIRIFLDFTGISVVEHHVFVEIPPNATTEEIAAILSDDDVGIITMPGFFEFYSRITSQDSGYLNGLFTFSSTMSYNQIITTLQNRPQSTETVRVKIIEGMTAREIGLLLEENNVCRAEDFTAFYKKKIDVYDFELRVGDNPLKFNQMEGYLFPDTYEFFIVNGLDKDKTIPTEKYAEVAVRSIYSNFNSQFTREMYRKIGDMGLSLDQFMTLASMVQWEAAETEDMKKVAAVFINRLNNPESFTHLDSDVTKKYANENILPYLNSENNTLLTPTIESYNTNLRDNGQPGLPPGAVCNPGLTAMLAVLDVPANPFPYFYFCANVETGEMFFADNLHQHEINLELAGIDIDNID